MLCTCCMGSWDFGFVLSAHAAIPFSAREGEGGREGGREGAGEREIGGGRERGREGE